MNEVPKSFAEWVKLLVDTSKAGGFPSVAPDPLGRAVCMYRGDNGRKCAAGLLIPDDKYNQSFEGIASQDLRHVMPDWACDKAWHVRYAQSSHDKVFAATGGWDHRKFIEELFNDRVIAQELFGLGEQP